MCKLRRLAAILLLMPVTAMADETSPVGKWETFDPATGKPKAVVEIAESPGGELTGTIITRFPPPGDPEKGLCVKCPGALKNKPLVGMTILWGVRHKGDEFSPGKILPPSVGRVLTARIKLKNGGQKLDVRVSFGLIARTGTWTRLAAAAGPLLPH